MNTQTFGGDKYVYYSDYGDGFMSVEYAQAPKVCILKIGSFLYIKGAFLIAQLPQLSF